jgi:hypothetical protein
VSDETRGGPATPAGLVPIEVEGFPLYLRKVTRADVRAYRLWRAAHPDADPDGLDGHAWLAARCLVDESGGRLFAEASELAEWPAVLVARIGRLVMEKCSGDPGGK